MTEPRADRDIQQALTTWMNGAAPTQPPTTLLEDTFVHTMKTAQAHVYPWHRFGTGSRPSIRAGSSARMVFVVLGMLIVVSLALALGGGGSGPTPTPTSAPTANPTPTSAAQASALPAAIAVAAEATVPVAGPISLVSRGAFLWVLAPGRIDRIDPSTDTVTASVALGPTTDLYNGIAANDAGLWATDSDAAVLYRVDPETRALVASIPAGFASKGVLANADGVWVADVHGGTVLRIDPATNKIVATITVGPTGSSGPNWLASGLGSIWVDIPNAGTIVRIDPATDTVQATLRAPDFFTACGGFAIGSDAVWVGGCSASQALGRIDPNTNLAVGTVALPGYGGPTLIGGVPWLSIDTGDATSGMLVRIDPASNTIDRVLVPGVTFGGGGDIVVAAGSVWVVDGYNNVVLRLPVAAFGA